MEVGRLRPDFLDRCQPAVPAAVNITYAQSVAASPACTAPLSGDLTDGHYRQERQRSKRSVRACGAGAHRNVCRRCQRVRRATEGCVRSAHCRRSPSAPLCAVPCSFPSGHTSTVFVFGLWAVGYCTWLLYVRCERGGIQASFCAVRCYTCLYSEK